ncbi:hypothetical protein [Maritalea porphyrae]|uniref:hypothetical protein n=1 Tax=Maritalea porphyrae TaxID=880732 RepID=UPI0022AF165C|nr:hypothetical protein [Maritalea porphyrae]MCZ4271865.1 hypothetical protein [Maritalea porphyrae]
MQELLRFLTVHNAELLFMAAAMLLAYAIARFKSVRWQIALVFSITPPFVFLLHEEYILRDLLHLLS